MWMLDGDGDGNGHMANGHDDGAACAVWCFKHLVMGAWLAIGIGTGHWTPAELDTGHCN